MKAKMKRWSKEVFGDVESAKWEAEVDLREGLEGLDSVLRKEREDLHFLVGDLVFKEEVKWRQRGKVKWATDGDGNTKKFHKMATGYRKRNYIDRLQVEAVGIIDNKEGIESEVINFFKRFYSSNEEVGWGVEGLNWCPISNVEVAWIERPFEEVEVCFGQKRRWRFVMPSLIAERTSRQVLMVSLCSSSNLAGTLSKVIL